MASTAYVSATLLGGKKVWTTGMLVWQEALQNLNAPLAGAFALVMTLASTLFALMVIWITRRFTPGRHGAPSGFRTLPGWVIRVLDLFGPSIGKLLLACSLLSLLLPLVLVLIQSFNDVPQATVAVFVPLRSNGMEGCCLVVPKPPGFGFRCSLPRQQQWWQLRSQCLRPSPFRAIAFPV